MNERHDYDVYIKFKVSSTSEDEAVDLVARRLEDETFLLFYYERVEKVT